MDLSAQEIEEFKIESQELLEAAENALLNVEKGDDFKKNYNEIFRSFHSLKGAAGMLDMNALQKHMHQLENIFEKYKTETSISPSHLTFFLNGIDAAMKLLNNEEVIFDFDQIKNSDPQKENKTKESQKKQIKKEVKNKKEDLVCIIDDEPDIAEIIESILNEAGIKTKSFTDGNIFLNELNELSPSLIISDIIMPEIDGMSILKRLKKEGPNIPVIFISGQLTIDFLKESINLGLFSIIEKPFEKEQILSFAKKAINQFKLKKMFHQSLNLMMFQFSDVEKMLKEQGKETNAAMFKSEIKHLLSFKKAMEMSE